MGLVYLIVTLGLVVSLAASIVSYSLGSIDRGSERRKPGEYYDNKWITPFNLMYDLGYSRQDKAKDRSAENKKRFFKE